MLLDPSWTPPLRPCWRRGLADYLRGALGKCGYGPLRRRSSMMLNLSCKLWLFSETDCMVCGQFFGLLCPCLMWGLWNQWRIWGAELCWNYESRTCVSVLEISQRGLEANNLWFGAPVPADIHTLKNLQEIRNLVTFFWMLAVQEVCQDGTHGWRIGGLAHWSWTMSCRKYDRGKPTQTHVRFLA